MLGVLAVLGFALHQSIQLVGEYRRLQTNRVEEPGLDLVLRGAHERLVPSLTATLATAVAVAPFAVLGSLPGFEIVGPMALVILGGLLTTALLSLFVVPTAFQGVGLVYASDAVAIPIEGAAEPEAVGARQP